MRLLTVCGLLAITTSAMANPVTLAPDESTSKDTFTYGAIPAGLPFGNATYIGASIESSGVHTVHSLIQFDLAPYAPSIVDNGILTLYARSKAGTPFASVASDPTPTAPVTVDVYRVLAAWDEATTTYSNEPAIESSPIASFVVTAVNQSYSVNITALVQGWLSPGGQNFGLELRQQAVVPVAGAPDAAVVFQSSGADNRPALTFSLPEPTTLASMAIASALLVRRRQSGR